MMISLEKLPFFLENWHLPFGHKSGQQKITLKKTPEKYFKNTKLGFIQKNTVEPHKTFFSVKIMMMTDLRNIKSFKTAKTLTSTQKVLLKMTCTESRRGRPRGSQSVATAPPALLPPSEGLKR